MQVLHQIRLPARGTAGESLIYADVGEAGLAVDVVAPGTQLGQVFFQNLEANLAAVAGVKDVLRDLLLTQVRSEVAEQVVVFPVLLDLFLLLDEGGEALCFVLEVYLRFPHFEHFFQLACLGAFLLQKTLEFLKGFFVNYFWVVSLLLFDCIENLA